MLRILAFIILFAALAGVVVPDAGLVGAGTALAQSNNAKPQQRKSLIELLFGGALRKNREAAAPKATPQAKRVKVRAPGSNTAVAAVAAPAPKVVDKNEDAAKVLVIGDFMSGALAEGLQAIFAENPAIQIVDKSNGLSGLVREDVTNWPEKVRELVEETKPVVVLALVGMNDRQQLRTAGGRLEKLTEEWSREYDRRADALARSVREMRVPMIWVGLPPVSKTTMNADYLVFNEIYKRTVENYGGLFVDVWDGFVDETGRFVRSGPDINGQIVSLRSADGINMTRAGKNKLGFYAEKAVKRMTGFGKEFQLSAIGSLSDTAVSTEPQYDPVSSGKTIVIALGAPSADGGSELEGGEGFLAASDARQSNSYELVTRGVFVRPQSGRVDAGWGQSSFELDRVETPEPVLANMRAMSLRSFLDDLPEAAPAGEQSGGEAQEPAIKVTN